VIARAVGASDAGAGAAASPAVSRAITRSSSARAIPSGRARRPASSPPQERAPTGTSPSRPSFCCSTIPWWGVDEALSELGEVDGRILIDTTNPYTDASYSELHEFPGSSGAETIQERVPGARVVKAWNHVYAQIVDSSPEFGSESATVFMCGDDAEAKRVVAGLMVGLAYGVGMGTDQALKLMRR
jgi:hypothetical protein